MVLRGDDAAIVQQVEHWLVLSTIAERKLVGLRAGSLTEELVAEADPEDGLDRHCATLHENKDLAYVLDCIHQHRGVARPVREEEACE